MNAIQAKANMSSPVWVDHPNPLRIDQPSVPAKHELFSEDHAADVVAIEQVWTAYDFYHDSGNGTDMASLFTPDGVVQHLWNDGHGVFVADSGIVAPEDKGKRLTSDGKQLGSGCVVRGREEIAYYFGPKMGSKALAWPGHSHHMETSVAVKVSEDGQTAVMSSPDIIAGVNDKGEGHFTTGGKRVFFKKTSEGWEIAELYAIHDNPGPTQGCDVNGPIGMRH
jgi:ketosteroid isomerase-like protein